MNGLKEKITLRGVIQTYTRRLYPGDIYSTERAQNEQQWLMYLIIIMQYMHVHSTVVATAKLNVHKFKEFGP